MQTTGTKRPRRHLTRTQYKFFRDVFANNYSIADAIHINAIRIQTFHRWLACPVFMRHLQTNMERCYIQARVEMIRDFPRAIKTVLKITDDVIRPEELRRLCTELVRLYSDFGRMERSAKRPPSGVDPARFDVIMEHCGVSLNPSGVLRAPSVAPELPQKPVFQLKNADSASVSAGGGENRVGTAHPTCEIPVDAS